MDSDLRTRPLAEHIRARRVAGRLQRKRNGTTTRNFHRFRRAQDIAFYLIIGIMALGILALAVL